MFLGGFVRSTVIANVKACLIAMIAASLLNLPARAADSAALGTIVAAKDAHLSNAAAVAGSNLYAGDTVGTDAEGSLRLQFGTTQVYLLSSSSAALGQEQGKVRAQLKAGTLGFSAANPDEFEIDTPIGSVHGASGARAFGQVSLVGPNHAIISAYDGTLILAGKCSSHSVNAGENYDVTLAPDEPCNSQVTRATTTPISGATIAKIAAAGGALALLLGLAFRHSSSDTCSNTTTC
jgi:hypothetical protein